MSKSMLVPHGHWAFTTQITLYCFALPIPHSLRILQFGALANKASQLTHISDYTPNLKFTHMCTYTHMHRERERETLRGIHNATSEAYTMPRCSNKN